MRFVTVRHFYCGEIVAHKVEAYLSVATECKTLQSVIRNARLGVTKRASLLHYGASYGGKSFIVQVADYYFLSG